MPKLLNQLKKCILEVQKRKRSVKYSDLAKVTKISEKTLFSTFEENKNPTLKTFERLMKVAGCHVRCNKTETKKCMRVYYEKLKKAA